MALTLDKEQFLRGPGSEQAVPQSQVESEIEKLRNGLQGIYNQVERLGSRLVPVRIEMPTAESCSEECVNRQTLCPFGEELRRLSDRADAIQSNLSFIEDSLRI